MFKGGNDLEADCVQKDVLAVRAPVAHRHILTATDDVLLSIEDTSLHLHIRYIKLPFTTELNL